jgi:hypothetical protein
MNYYNKIFLTYIFFFLIYFIFSFPISWLLLNFPFQVCNIWLIQNKINENGCLLFDYKETYSTLKIFFIWIFFFIISLKLIFLTKLVFFENILNSVINKISKINITKKKFITIITVIILISSLNRFFYFDKYNFILIGISAINLFLIFHFIRLKKYFLLLICLIPYFFSIYTGEISNIIHLLIGLNFFHVVAKKCSWSSIFKYLLIFFIILITLLALQKYLILNYGYSAANRTKVVFEKKSVSFIKETQNPLSKNYLNNEDFFRIAYSEKLIPTYKTPEIDFIKYSNINFIYQRSFSRISEIVNSTYIIYLIDKKKVSTLNGLTYEKLKSIFVPRFLYPNKPTETYGNILICDYGIGYIYNNKDDCLKKNVTSINLNIILEAYINFKYFGVIVISILFSIISRFILLTLSNKNPIINNLGYCLFTQAIMYSSNLTGVIGGLIMFLFFIALLLPIKQFNE